MCEIYNLILDLIEKDGLKNIKDLLWVRVIDEHWTVAVNGCPIVKSYKGLDISPYNMYIEWCNFPAGIINPYGGQICAGEKANEDTLIEAIKKAIA
jgi:hypothetical protein